MKNLPFVNSTYGRKLYAVILPWLIILAGAVVRIMIWAQNRNLFIDEANVARNMYERGFAGLAQPLDYGQYAPPVFLWLVKGFTVITGFGEMSLRAFPLITGLAALVVFWRLLKLLVADNTLWYPLAMLVVSYIYIRYATELKQYMPDVLVTMLLLLFALRIRAGERRFAAKWIVIGSVAIWSSMPSVFVLAGVGLYYTWQALQQKSRKQFLQILFVSLVWLVQFALYYMLVLRSEIGSGFLQNYHQEYFLFPLPGNSVEWQHNWGLVNVLFRETSGYGDYNFWFNSCMFVLGLWLLFRRQKDRFFLLVVPLLLLLAAAALRQFSLIPRVALFSMPLMLIIIAIGLDQVLSVRYILIRIAIIVFAVLNVKHHSRLDLVAHSWDNEEITAGMDEVVKAGISNRNLILENAAGPAFIYYTQIHPAQAQWGNLRGAYIMPWNINIDSMGNMLPARSALLCTAGNSDGFEHIASVFRQYNRQTGYFEKSKCHVYFFEHAQAGH